MAEIRSVFISSLIRGYEAERDAARRAVESLRMVPVMSETLGAAAASPRQALLDEVSEADALLLLLFPHYGEVDESGMSPTEQEFSRAEELGRPIVALAQDGELEPRQREFLVRVRGKWGEGHLTGSFSGTDDVQEAVVRGLTNLRRAHEGSGEDLSAAQSRAVELARGEERGGSYSSSCQARIAFVPASTAVTLDALTLEDPALTRAIADAARAADLAPHEVGLETRTSRNGIRLFGSAPQRYESIELVLSADGAITVEGPVGGQGNFGSMRIEPQRVEHLLCAAGDFAQRVWERVDLRGDVRRIGAAVAVLDANGKVFGTAPEGGSLTIGGATALPAVVVAPENGAALSRGEVASQDTAKRLLAEVRAVFRDADAEVP